MRSWDKLRENQEQSAEADGLWQQLWSGSAAVGNDFQPDVEAGLSRLKQRIAQDDAPTAKMVSLSSSSRWLRSIAAAAVLALVAWGVNTFMVVDDTPYAWSEVTTAVGESREVVLPDGSTITLKENTRLSYRNDLDVAAIRDIRLEGDAFFDVNRRPEQPFIIRTARTEVKVLGTSFNVRETLSETHTTVEVSTGKVAVRSLEKNAEEVFLTAGQAVRVDDQGYQPYTLSKNLGKGTLSPADELQFRNISLEDALLQIEETYQVDLIWDAAAIRNCVLTGNWQEEDFKAVLTILNDLTGLSATAVGENRYQLAGSCE